MVERLVQQPIKAIKFILGAFPAGSTLAYLDYESISNILRKLGQASQGNILKDTFMDQLYIPMLDQIGSTPLIHADKILAALLQAVPSVKVSLQEDPKSLLCIKKLISVSLIQKQSDSAGFNLAGILQCLYEKTLDGSASLLCELLIEIAIESKCFISRIFSCLQLHKMHSNMLMKAKSTDSSDISQLRAAVKQDVMTGLILILMNDDSSLIRQHGANIAKVYQDIFTELKENDYLKVFGSSSKPEPKAKKSDENNTPIK